MTSVFARRLWRALIQNSIGLLLDAKVLAEHGSSGRARSLGILAAEELGKASLLYSAAEDSWAESLPEVELPDDFEQRSRSHPVKLTLAAGYGQGGSVMWDYWFASHASEALTRDEMASAAKEYNLKKQAGFYVDWRLGEVHSPADVDDVGVTEMLEEVAQAVNMLLVEDHVRMQNSGEQPDWMHSVWEPLSDYGKKDLRRPARILGDRDK